MLEIPEAIVITDQINQTLPGKKIVRVTVAQSPHKFTFYFEDPQDYPALLCGKSIGQAFAYGGHVEILSKDTKAVISLNDGVNLRYHEPEEKQPSKHQLLVEFDDGSALTASVAMYGGIFCFPKGAFENFYYTVAKEKPSPLSNAFDYAYFLTLFDEKTPKLSAKAFLATEQRIPGLGNGVAQDILLNAKIHPKRKMSALDDSQKKRLFQSIKDTLAEMTKAGGRDTEKDLFGQPGGYETKLSKHNISMTCPVCGGGVKKENYLGGSIYYCERCQGIGQK